MGMDTRSFTFTGPDGIQHRWALGAMRTSPGRVSVFPNSLVSPPLNQAKLVTSDEKKVAIAQFHRPHYFINKQKARLEIQPAVMDMLDHIIVTFVFVEQTRREREAAAKSQNFDPEPSGAPEGV